MIITTVPNIIGVVYLVRSIVSIYNHRTTKTNQKYPSVNL